MAPVWFDRNISMYNAIDVTPCKWPPMYVVASYVCGRYMQYWPSGSIVLYVCKRGRRENPENVIMIDS